MLDQTTHNYRARARWEKNLARDLIFYFFFNLEEWTLNVILCSRRISHCCILRLSAAIHISSYSPWTPLPPSSSSLDRAQYRLLRCYPQPPIFATAKAKANATHFPTYSKSIQRRRTSPLFRVHDFGWRLWNYEDYDDDDDHECPTSYILLNDKINKIFYHQYIKNKCPTSLNKSPDLGFYISNLSLTCTSESVAFILGFETNFYYNKN